MRLHCVIAADLQARSEGQEEQSGLLFIGFHSAPRTAADLAICSHIKLFRARIWARADIVCKRMEIFAAASEFKYATLAFVISSRQGCENAADLSVD